MKDPKSNVYRNLIGKMLEMMDEPASKGEESDVEEIQEEEKEDIEENKENVGGMNDVLRDNLKSFMQPKRKASAVMVIKESKKKSPMMGKK